MSESLETLANRFSIPDYVVFGATLLISAAIGQYERITLTKVVARLAHFLSDF